VKVAVLSLGSRGDFEPNLAVAQELRSRGHLVTVTTNTANTVRSRENDFDTVEMPVDLGPILKQFVASKSLVKFGREIARMEARSGADIDEALIAGCDGVDAIVTSPMTTMRAQCIAERTGAPLVVNLPYPLERSREYHPSFLGDLEVPTALRRPAHAVFEQVHMQANRTALRALRRKLGLSSTVPNLFARMRQERTPHELLISPTLFPTPSDWPDHCTVAGMPATWGDTRVDAELEHWIADGTAPLFFGFGSMPVPDSAALLDTITDVAARLGKRALIGAGWSDLVLGTSPDRNVFITRSVDYTRVLPSCAAAVHHGGSGTTHDVARAGIPAVLATVGGDQPLWGRRVHDLGIGASFPFRSLTADRLHRALTDVLTDATQARAQSIGHAMAGENGTTHLSDTVERLVTTSCA
jgi:sterol 3beta-glucosyltransferase